MRRFVFIAALLIPTIVTVANDFYEAMRCGLLHEARTKGKWVIWSVPSRRQADSSRPNL